MKILSALLLLFSFKAHALGLIYQGATATLASTKSLITYTSPMQVLGPTYQVYQRPSDASPTTVSTDVTDPNYVNGIYTCTAQGTYSVGASISVSGTISVNSTVTMSVELSQDGGTTWTVLRTTGQGPTTGLGKSYGYIAFLVPCPAQGKIRVTASTSVVLPAISTVPDENTLSITRIF